jgi:site-specific recombinase XerD
MQTLVSPVPKSWIIGEYEKCEQLAEEMKQRMTEFLLSLHSVKENTKHDYLSKTKMFGIFLAKHGMVRFEDANRTDIDLFLSRYDNENTLNLYIHAFRSFYNFLNRQETVSHLKLYKVNWKR